MDIFNKFKDLVNESLLCKSYKGMTVAKRVLCIIALAPFIAIYVGMLLMYWLIAVIYRFACNYLEYIHAFIAKERAEVRHATEAVIYLIAFPWIFALKLLSSVLALVLMIAHFFTSMIGYVATFGGIKFSPFVLDNADRSEKKSIKHATAALVVFIVLSLVLLCASVCFKPIASGAYELYRNNEIRATFRLEMEKAKASGKITSDEWNEFAALYNNKQINSENYAAYAEEYLDSTGDEIWSIYKDFEFSIIVAGVSTVLVSAYILFTIIYVSVYSNAIKRKKEAEEFFYEQASAIAE